MQIFPSIMLLLLVACTGSPGGSLLGPADSGDAHTGPVADTSTDDGPSDNPTDAARYDSSDATTCKLLKVYSSSNRACNACAEKECCEIINACFSSKACDEDYINCSLACVLETDASKSAIDHCVKECQRIYNDGYMLFDAANACAESKCTADCR